MAEPLHFDARGRITIPKRFRDHLGDDVLPVLTPGGVLLYPVPDAPLDIDVPAQGASGEAEARRELDA